MSTEVLYNQPIGPLVKPTEGVNLETAASAGLDILDAGKVNLLPVEQAAKLNFETKCVAEGYGTGAQIDGLYAQSSVIGTLAETFNKDGALYEAYDTPDPDSKKGPLLVETAITTAANARTEGKGYPTKKDELENVTFLSLNSIDSSKFSSADSYLHCVGDIISFAQKGEENPDSEGIASKILGEMSNGDLINLQRYLGESKNPKYDFLRTTFTAELNKRRNDLKEYTAGRGDKVGLYSRLDFINKFSKAYPDLDKEEIAAAKVKVEAEIAQLPVKPTFPEATSSPTAENTGASTQETQSTVTPERNAQVQRIEAESLKTFAEAKNAEESKLAIGEYKEVGKLIWQFAKRLGIGLGIAIPLFAAIAIPGVAAIPALWIALAGGGVIGGLSPLIGGIDKYATGWQGILGAQQKSLESRQAELAALAKTLGNKGDGLSQDSIKTYDAIRGQMGHSPLAA